MMESSDAKAASIKQSRREIIGVLNAMYHIGPCSFDLICGALVHLELPDDECVKRDLVYLCEKKYVKWTNEAPRTPWVNRLYKLTATGNDIANRISVDPTLEP